MKYRLKKPIPGVKAGVELEERKDGLYIGQRCVITSYQIRAMDDQGTTGEWLEEVSQQPKIPGQYVPDCPWELFGDTHVINLHGDTDLAQSLPLRHIKRLAKLGLSFETEEECQKWAEWLRARATLMRDAKGFKPNWLNKAEDRFIVDYSLFCGAVTHGHLGHLNVANCKNAIGHEFYFASQSDAEASIKDHPNEWKTYLGVEE